MNRIYNKLVRDRIPEIISSSNKVAKTSILEDDDYDRELRKKLLEESEEILNSLTKESLCEEIADLCEVIDTLIEFHNLDKAKVIEIQLKKKEDRGGFAKKTFLLEVSDHE